MNKFFPMLEYVFYKLVITAEIAKLNIECCGVDDDGTNYVKIKDGFFFFGPEARDKDLKYYKLLPRRIKKTLPFKAYTIASDIAIRFKRGGLKLGGPRKERFYMIKPGDTTAEMGAFRGYFCLYMSQQVGASGKVVAIEPQESNQFYLRKNIEKNNIANISMVAKGVWKEKDVLTFKRSEEDFQSSSIDLEYSNSDSYKMEVEDLDGIFGSLSIFEVDFMVVQLNGAELEALEGLNNVKAHNISIAARYKKDGVVASRLIKKHLTKKCYQVKILNRDYVFANLNN